MVTVSSIDEMRRLSREAHSRGERVAFVPTMGALHEGHLSLVRLARQHGDTVVVSIFVNPIQFSPEEDLALYPRDLKCDRGLLDQENCDILFLPDEKALYPPGHATRVCVAGLRDRLCGVFRPGHFDGVTTVVAQLFHIVEPDVAVFGQKDAQQAIIVHRMIVDLNWFIKLVVGPTVREPDGLAMSSRNRYLTPKERQAAPVLYRALQWARHLVDGGERDAAVLIKEMRSIIEEEETARIDYVAVIEPETLSDLDEIRGSALLAVAVRFGSARLIDNLLVKVR